jgi:hypothetical protein
MGDAQKFDRTRAVLLGQCVMAAYKMYEGAPNILTPTPTNIPQGYTFVAWVQMQDSLFGQGAWTFYGVLLANATQTEYVLAIRGTEGLTEWLENLRSIVLVPMQNFGMVGDGFYNIYQTFRVIYPPREALGAESLELEGTFAKQVAAAMQRHGAQEGTPLAVTGHSLGAALATLYVVDHSLDPSKYIVSQICTFASPRVGDREFASTFDQLIDRLKIPSWRIVDEPDWVPKLPIIGFWHVQAEQLYNAAPCVVWTLACFHYLETYLHMLDARQQLKPCCVWPQPTLSRSRAALSAPTQKEIALSTPHEAGTTINITIKIE